MASTPPARPRSGLGSSRRRTPGTSGRHPSSGTASVGSAGATDPVTDTRLGAPPRSPYDRYLISAKPGRMPNIIPNDPLAYPSHALTGAVLNRRKVAKHFALTITDDAFRFSRNTAAIAAEAALDGFYVVRTNLPAATLDDAGTVRTYKSLAQVERAFRSLKGIDLRIRPLFHWLAPRVRAHVFLCLLAYHVEWHMRRKLAPMLYDDDDRGRRGAARERCRSRAAPRRQLCRSRPVASRR